MIFIASTLCGFVRDCIVTWALTLLGGAIYESMGAVSLYACWIFLALAESLLLRFAGGKRFARLLEQQEANSYVLMQ